MPDTKETFPRGPSNEAQLFAELGRMMAERDDWKTRCEAACDKVTQQAEQIRRLRELLSDSLEYIEVNISEAKALRWWSAAEAILKETAPTA